MSRQQFYDPFVEQTLGLTAEEQADMQLVQMRGVQIPITGTYVLIDDVVTALRQYAHVLEDPNDSAVVFEAAAWLASSSRELPVLPEEEPIPLAVMDEPPYGAEELDGSPDIGRVEVYPDPPEDPNPKWYARSIDTGGYILQVTAGSFDQDWVIANAQERWPGKDIFLLKNAGEDSKWVEDGTRGVFPSKGPPPRRLWVG